MLKKILMTVASFVVIFSSVTPVFAAVKHVSATPTPTATPAPVAVDSFELFWPMVAGKTMESKVYFLKTLKEKVRGFFIFGSAQKADYDIFLGIKRMLEVEVLINAKNTDLANKTIDSANSDLDKANSALTNAKNSGDVDQDTKNEINIRVSNLKMFAVSLQNKYPDYKDKLQSVLDRLNLLTI